MNLYSFLSSVAFMLYLFFGIIGFRKLGRTLQGVSFLIFSVALSVYSLGYVFSFGTSSPEWARFWYRIALTGCTIFPVFIVLLSFTLSRPSFQLKFSNFLLLALPAIIFLYLIYFTPDFYAASFKQISHFSGNVTVPIINISNPTTTLFIVYMVIYGFGGILLMQLWGYKSKVKRVRRIAKVILFSAIVTSITAVFSNYFARIYEINFVVDIGHIFALVAYFGFYYSIEKYQFLTPSPNIAIKNILDSAREIIVITNEENKIISINKHSLALLGYSKEEINSVDIHSIFINEKKDLKSTLVTEAENNSRIEVKMVTRSGNSIPVSLTSARIYDEFDEVLARVYIGTDITDHVKINELLHQKEKIISIIAHDLRNPLGIALNVSQELKTSNELENDEEQMLFEVQQSSLQRSLSLLDNLLLWARIDDVDNFYSPGKTDLHEIILLNLHLFAANAKSKKVKIINNVPPDFVVFADENMISTVIRNLLGNAIKFTNPDGLITISPITNGTLRGISISDNGVGIHIEDQVKLFDVRKKVGRDSDGNTGTGLGLVICKEFIEKNRGSISVESELGKGSTFSIELPLKERI